MRTTVALVEARPETILADYGRVLDLSGLSKLLDGEIPRILVAADKGGFAPGWKATPWQLDGVLDWLGPQAETAEVVAVGARGAGALPPDAMWLDQMTRRQAQAADAEFLRPHRHVSQQLHPSLDAVLPGGVQLPVGLAKGPAVLLTSPTMQPRWGLAGAAQMLQSVVTCGAAASRKAPAVEVTAEAVGVAREVMPRLGAVLDGTLWGVGGGAGGQQCVARNVLLAGTDPLAVDAVAMRLAGIDPARVPWLRLCRDRGFGRVMPADIQVVGRTDLLDLDFGLLDLEVGPDNVGNRDGLWNGLAEPVTRLIERALGRDTSASLSDTPWQKLYDEYTTAERAGTP